MLRESALVRRARGALLWSVMLLGCGRAREPARDPLLVAPSEPEAPAPVEDEAPVTAPRMEPAPDADQRAFAEGIERLAWRLWPELRARPGNRVLSPASSSLALAMAASVVRGAASTEVLSLLGAGLDGARVHRAAGTLLRSWQAELAEGSGLLAVQRVFVDRGVRFEPDVNARLREVYGAPVGLVDTGGPEGARRRIDGFMAARTRSAVREVVPEYAVVADAPAMVASAAHARFACDAEVTTTRFRVGGVMAVEVPAVTCRGAILSGRGEGFTLLRVPARGGEAVLDVVLPDEGLRLADVEARVDGAAMRAAVEALRPVRAVVTLPKLQTLSERREGIRNELYSVGLGGLFDPERSDLARPGRRGGWVSELYLRARFDVDASGASGPVEALAGRVTHAVDRPFLFVLRDARFGAALALGHVVDPRE